MPGEIKFHIPYFIGNEKHYVAQAIDSTCISGDGPFTRKCHEWFEKKFGFKKVFLTTSCTDALEMAAILLDIKEGDEVIVPSYTFVSTANAFMMRGAKIVFADSCNDNPNIDAESLENLITPKTKAIVIVHYAGMICDVDKICALVKKHDLFLVEDAALALGSSYKGKHAGCFGHLSTFSFHVTKNITCGEGGMLVVNDERFIKRAEIIREKGTNRNAFYRGEVDKYGWVDIGSSFLPSDMLAAFLYAQLEIFDEIQEKRLRVWKRYYSGLKPLYEGNDIILPTVNSSHALNGSTFYFTCSNLDERTRLIQHLKKNGIHCSFHYQALHTSQFCSGKKSASLPNAEKYSDCLIRLPLYPSLTTEEVNKVIDQVLAFYK